MTDLIREAPLGQLMRFLSRNKLFQYPEEQPGFVLPLQYAVRSSLEKGTDHGSSADLSVHATDGIEKVESFQGPATLLGKEFDDLGMTRTKSKHYSLPYSSDRVDAERQLDLERTQTLPIIPQVTHDGIILVDWYTTDDPANPHNWSSRKRALVTFLICAYTWVVYTGSSIYAPSEGGVMEQFGVSPVLAALPLSLYVLAYGLGPLIFAPLCEIPAIGRNPVYILTFVLFTALSFPTAVVNDFSGLLALRFFQGFFGSPALANGGATFSDMYSLLYVPYQLSWWVFAAWGGPALGPLMAGFAVPAKNWHWSLWEIAWMAAPMLIALLLLMPETSTSTILLRRARRLRQVTRESRLQSQSEIDQRQLSASGILVSALIKPIEITLKDPAVMFVNIYTALFYGIYYSQYSRIILENVTKILLAFFEVFPLIFPSQYGFNLGETGLAFLSCQVGAGLGLAVYFAYLHWYMVPDNLKNGLRQQEHRLVPAILGSFFISSGLFIFAWTARASIHWIVPLIGVVVFVFGTFLVLQSIFVYLPLSYPEYAASLFAGNDLVRSSMACGSVLFARPLFLNLGIAEGVTLLGGLSIVGIIGTGVIYRYGAQLRARSKFAQK
ncbi:hypothetical protein LTR56_020587 [Elasticomyces elasticus]|nr:hypothetical protein LTR22_025449 [Elasticomyces elasticus]KAK3625130.1 hypothetical protein LTR56_020587 [Elasticomyces elasticus]KAK5740590.1 hypothetical protein LTS12_024908 [Elasticomyces elasticus]